MNMKSILAIGAALAVVGSTGALARDAHAHGGPRGQGATPTAARIYDVTAGYGDDDYAANVFNPQVLQVHVGDTVRWHVGGLLEPHIVAFGPKATLDHLAATFQVVVPAKVGPPTVEINPQLTYPSQRATYDGTGLIHSGLMAKGSPDDSWSLTFTQPGAYTY